MAGKNGADENVPENDVAAQNASAWQYDWRPRPDPTVLTTQQLRETESALNRTIVERISGLRELLEQRLEGMDRATEVLTERIDKIIPDNVHGRDVIRGEFAAADQALRELMGSRLDGMDKADELLADSVSKFPSDMDRAIGALKSLLMGEIQLARAETQRTGDVAQEKFSAIEGTFNSNDKALTAALAAQEKAAAEQQKSNTLAIDKSEKNTQEQSKANQAQTEASIQSQAALIADLKERLVRIEATGAGATASRIENREQRTDQRLNTGQVIAMVSIVILTLGLIISVTALILHK